MKFLQLNIRNDCCSYCTLSLFTDIALLKLLFAPDVKDEKRGKVKKLAIYHKANTSLLETLWTVFLQKLHLYFMTLCVCFADYTCMCLLCIILWQVEAERICTVVTTTSAQCVLKTWEVTFHRQSQVKLLLLIFKTQNAVLHRHIQLSLVPWERWIWHFADNLYRLSNIFKVMKLTLLHPS